MTEQHEGPMAWIDAVLDSYGTEGVEQRFTFVEMPEGFLAAWLASGDDDGPDPWPGALSAMADEIAAGADPAEVMSGWRSRVEMGNKKPAGQAGR